MSGRFRDLLLMVGLVLLPVALVCLPLPRAYGISQVHGSGSYVGESAARSERPATPGVEASRAGSRPGEGRERPGREVRRGASSEPPSAPEPTSVPAPMSVPASTSAPVPTPTSVPVVPRATPASTSTVDTEALPQRLGQVPRGAAAQDMGGASGAGMGRGDAAPVVLPLGTGLVLIGLGLGSLAVRLRRG